MATFVALGDSITLGIGDPVPGRCWRGWAALLAGGLPDPAFHNLAVSGAQAADVERDQLPRALALRPDFASVIVGVNDTLRGGFDPARLRASVTAVVAALRGAGAVVLTMRLPDPGRMLRLPASLAKPLARRAREVNAVMDEIAARFGTIHFDAAGDPQAYDRRIWSADRLHPNERGHRLIATRFHDLLAAAGHRLGARPCPEPSSPPPRRWQVLCWMATKGTAWAVRRSRDLLPALLALAVREWWAGPPAAAGRAGEPPARLRAKERRKIGRAARSPGSRRAPACPLRCWAAAWSRERSWQHMTYPPGGTCSPGWRGAPSAPWPATGVTRKRRSRC